MNPVLPILNFAECIQLVAGSILGTVLAINLSRFGLSFRDPKTRWQALAVLVLFLLTYLVLSDLLVK